MALFSTGADCAAPRLRFHAFRENPSQDLPRGAVNREPRFVDPPPAAAVEPDMATGGLHRLLQRLEISPLPPPRTTAARSPADRVERSHTTPNYHGMDT